MLMLRKNCQHWLNKIIPMGFQKLREESCWYTGGLLIPSIYARECSVIKYGICVSWHSVEESAGLQFINKTNFHYIIPIISGLHSMQVFRMDFPHMPVQVLNPSHLDKFDGCRELCLLVNLRPCHVVHQEGKVSVELAWELRTQTVQQVPHTFVQFSFSLGLYPKENSNLIGTAVPSVILLQTTGNLSQQ